MADEHKHTPGPWYVAEKARFQGDVRFVRTSTDSSGIIGVTNDHDAHFIAAAPDLLERCKRMESAIQDIRVAALWDHKSSDTREDIMEAIAIKCQEALGH